MVVERKPQERRSAARHHVVRPCKVRDRRGLLYAPGQTTDISTGGAMIKVDRARPFGPGDELDVVIAWTDRPVLAADAMVRARVKRVVPIDSHHQALALEFVQEQQEVPALAKAA